MEGVTTANTPKMDWSSNDLLERGDRLNSTANSPSAALSKARTKNNGAIT